MEDPSFVMEDNVLVGKRYYSGLERGDIGDLILDSLNEAPDFVGQYDVKSGKKITFAEMRERSIRCALWLKKRGIGKDDVVVVSTPNQMDDYVPCLATFYIGAIFNPWYYELTPSMAKHYFELMSPRVIFTSKESVSLLTTIAHLTETNCEFVVYGDHPDFISLDELIDQATPQQVENFKPNSIESPESQIGAVLFSSGSTGVQKGAALSYDTVVNNRMKYTLIRPGLNMLWYPTLAWITGTHSTTTAIRLKATRFIHRDFEPDETSKIIETCKIQWLFITPTMLNQMCKVEVFKRYDFSSLEVLLLTGSKPSAKVLEDVKKALPRVIISNSFGMTELGGFTTIHTNRDKKIDSIGRIIETVKMKIVDPATGRALGPDEKGEICIKLKNCMQGYYKLPEESNKLFDKDGWLHSGDQGYYDVEGEVTITGRLKELIIIQNHHVSPSQIEEILLQHDDVMEAAVVSIPHRIDIERAIAFVRLRRGAKVTLDELRDLPMSYNKYFQLTGGVVVVDKIPLTTSSKKNLKELKEMANLYADQF